MNIVRDKSSLKIIGISSICALIVLTMSTSTLRFTMQHALAISGDELYSDFNGDGYDDLAIGIPNEDIGTITNAGAVSVLYGAASGLQTGSLPDQFWHQNSPGVDNEAEADDEFGFTLATGNFNGDGYGDLAIGVLEGVGSLDFAGAVNVFYGSSLGLRTSAAPDGTGRADQFWHQGKPGVEDVEEEGDSFGDSLVSGDFNGDGFSDLAIGASREDLGTFPEAGAVHILYGSSNGLQTSSPADQFWTQNSSGVENAVENSELFAYSLSSGDFNGDGYDDLAIGVPNESIGTVQFAGAVNVLYGSSQGLRVSAAADGSGRADQFWHQGKPAILNVEEYNDVFGLALASGDMNSDGFSDLAIGVPGEGIGTFQSGAVNVIYGSALGLQADSPANQFWYQDSPGVGDTEETEDRFGWTLDVADFNNDGFADLAVSSPEEDLGSECSPQECFDKAGIVHVIYGSSGGLESVVHPAQVLSQDYPNLDDSPQARDEFGSSLGTGDFNNDSLQDLAIGVKFEGVVSPDDAAGVVHVLAGSTSGLTTTNPADQLWHQNKPGVNDSIEHGDQFGRSLS